VHCRKSAQHKASLLTLIFHFVPDPQLRESSQYLHFNLGGVHYLLSSSASEAIELRDNLTVNTAAVGNVGAWRSNDDTRWPAYCLDRDLRVSREDAWERAIFLDARPNPVGLLANQVQMLPSGETEVVSFTPLGPPPTPAGHLFTGAWVRGPQVVLVFDPAALTAYLQGLEPQPA
jgi:hypothetical protein